MCIHTCNFFVHGECNTCEFYQGVLWLQEASSKDHSGSGFLLFSWKLCAEGKFRALLGSQSTDPAKALDTREGKVNLHLCDLTASTPVKELLRLSQLSAQWQGSFLERLCLAPLPRLCAGAFGSTCKREVSSKVHHGYWETPAGSGPSWCFHLMQYKFLAVACIPVCPPHFWFVLTPPNTVFILESLDVFTYPLLGLCVVSKGPNIRL